MPGASDRPRKRPKREPIELTPAPRTFKRKLVRTPRLNIIHEDADLLVVNKPTNVPTAGLAVGDAITLLQVVKDHLREYAPKIPRRVLKEQQFLAEEHGMPQPDRVPPVGVIHRLDKEASGLVVFSKSDKAYHWLKDDFKTKRAKRKYIAIVEGNFGEVGKTGSITSMLREDQAGKVYSLDASRAVDGAGKAPARPAHLREMDERLDEELAKPATTHYEVLYRGRGHTMVLLELQTGRKHQIRVHLSEAGHPIVGDEKYGARTDPLKRLGLHAAELSFAHPANGARCTFRSPPPPAFYRAVDQEPPDEEGMSDVPGASAKGGRPASATAWENVATWYDAMIDEQRNDHYANVIIPGTLRLMQPRAKQKILDIACGQGVIARQLAELGCFTRGFDASPGLISAAKTRSRHLGDLVRFEVMDATKLGQAQIEPASFDGACCVMALANIDPLEPLFDAVAELLKPGGHFAFVITHPAFRAHGQSSWGWDDKQHRQYRRIDGYLSHGSKAILMHPGESPDVTTTSFHRPLQTYTRLLAASGLLIQTFEEWPALRNSQPGPRADEENRARREIPLFLAVRALKPHAPASPGASFSGGSASK